MEKWIGFSLSALGFLMLYWIRRRQFKRTTAFGTQIYKSFESFWFTRLWERLALSFGLILLILGIIVVLFYW